MTLANPFFSRPDRVVYSPTTPESPRADLYVCTMLMNHIRFRSRWKLFEDFCHEVVRAGAKLCVVELAFGNRKWVLTPEFEPHIDVLLQIRTPYELWYKENAMNLLVERLPQDWQYMALVDADTLFARRDWANETVQQLQHYQVLQMWSEMVDLDSNHEVIGRIRSFIWNWINGYLPNCEYEHPKPPYPGAPGLAWAWRRDAWDAVGRLIDWGVVGAGDSYMAYALIGKLAHTLRRKFHSGYTDPMLQWESYAERYIQRNVGVVDGLALHYFHGPKALRNYGRREEILVNNQFNPATDLKRDAQGLYQLEVRDERQMRLRDALLAYFRSREEDQLSNRIEPPSFV